MVRKATVEQMSTATVDVILDDGVQYLGCDFPECPFLDQENWFSFWFQGALLIIPRERIKRVQYNMA